MRWAAFRGVVAFAMVVGAITYTWHRIEDRPVETAITVATTSTTTTPPIVAVTTSTTTPFEAEAATCARTEAFIAEASLIPDGSGPGPLARLALSYWSDLSLVAIESAVVEIEAVVGYYQKYLDTAEPYNFDTVTIILDGDKERFEQLVTRPAPGLESSRDKVKLLCGVEIPDKPWISLRGFNNLEDRLLDAPG